LQQRAPAAAGAGNVNLRLGCDRSWGLPVMSFPSFVGWMSFAARAAHDGPTEKPMRTFFFLAAFIVLLSAPAYSQGINLTGLGEKTRSPADEQKDQKIDEQYKSATEKIPSRNTKVDPWHDMRSAPASRNGQAKP
jgi:hypothetical protein